MGWGSWIGSFSDKTNNSVTIVCGLVAALNIRADFFKLSIYLARVVYTYAFSRCTFNFVFSSIDPQTTHMLICGEGADHRSAVIHCTTLSHTDISFYFLDDSFLEDCADLLESWYILACSVHVIWLVSFLVKGHLSMNVILPACYGSVLFRQQHWAQRSSQRSPSFNYTHVMY